MTLMLCEVGSEEDIKKHHLDWFGSRKMDGVRCLALCGNGLVALRGRNGTDYTKKFPEIVEDLKDFNGIYDGEICCDTFDHTSSRVHTDNQLKSKLLVKQYPATFWIFDKVSELPLKDRLQEIRGLNRQNVKVLTHTTDLITLWEQAKQGNWEGIVIKSPNSPYLKKRSPYWLKIKKSVERFISFNQFEVNPAGIKISNGFHTVQVSGSEARLVMDEIIKNGNCECQIKGLEITASDHIRMPVFVARRGNA